MQAGRESPQEARLHGFSAARGACGVPGAGQEGDQVGVLGQRCVPHVQKGLCARHGPPQDDAHVAGAVHGVERTAAGVDQPCRACVGVPHQQVLCNVRR